MNAYSAAYTAPNGDKILYFALEKNKDNGTNNAAFWFLQDGSVNCSSTGGAVDFAGNHREGDILVTSAFSSGGRSILVFRWGGRCQRLHRLVEQPDQVGGRLQPAPDRFRGDCKTAQSLPTPLRTTRFRRPTRGHWPRTPTSQSRGSPGGRHARRRQHGRAAGLPRGAIDPFANAPGGGTAPLVLQHVHRRHAPSTAATATLFDYARGQLGQCRTTLTTDADIASPASIDDGSISSGTDVATPTITGTPTWGGTLTWWLCGLIPSGLCNKAEGRPADCATVSNSSPAADFVSEPQH